MTDRLSVAYKSPYQRILELAAIAAFALVTGALWRDLVPQISPSYIVFAAFLLGFVVVPPLGSLWATRRGAPRMSVEERDQRYLAELGPIGTVGPRLPSYAALPRPAHGRRSSGRSRRLG